MFNKFRKKKDKPEEVAKVAAPAASGSVKIFEITSELTGVDEKDVADNLFVVPPGWKKVGSNSWWARQGNGRRGHVGSEPAGFAPGFTVKPRTTVRDGFLRGSTVFAGPIQLFLLIPVMLLLLVGLLAACQVSQSAPAPWPEAAKIKFRIEDIQANGLRGPPDGLVSVAYEFCVPADNRVYQQLLGIDSGLKIQPAAPGRIGCHAGQALVIGETGQPRWRNSLQALSRLDYVEEIRECFFE